ncbi:MAG: hypothetical protein AAF799_43720 [Myxococcota bacterium]
MPARLSKYASRCTIAALVGLWVGCQPPAPTDDDGAATSGTTTAGTTEPFATTFAAPDACKSSNDCGEDEHCVAPYDPASEPPMGPSACVSVCIEANDLTRWCLDDAGCCGDLQCNQVDGFCEASSLDGTSSDGAVPTSSSDGTGSDSGTSDSGSGDTDGGSSSGGSSTSGR